MVEERVGVAAGSFKFSHPDVIGPHRVAGREHGPLRAWLRISSVLASSAIELQSWTLHALANSGNALPLTSRCTGTEEVRTLRSFAVRNGGRCVRNR